jgi:multidrug efflux pump subunit AcrB
MSKGLYQYALTDQNVDELNSWAPKLVEKLRQYPQIKDPTSDQQFRGLQETVVIDRDAAARLGIQPQAVDSTLYSAFGQRQVSIIYTQQNQYHVVLEVDPKFQLGPSSLDKVYVKSPSGNQVPLSAIAHFQLDNTPLSVNHQGQFPCVTISFNTAPGVSLGQATQIIQRAAKDLGMPSTIRGNFAGTAQVFQSSLATEPLLILTALIAVYIVLGMLYESLIHPLTILSTLPSAGLGALLAMLVTGNELSIVSIIGIILLIGIVKKNAIMMVDFAIDAERHEGLMPEESIYQACLVRFRPIMMTTLAAMFGGCCDRGRSHRFTDPDALHDSGNLSGARPTAATETETIFVRYRFAADRVATPFRIASKVNLRVSGGHAVAQNERCYLVRIRECVPESEHRNPTSGNPREILWVNRDRCPS